MTAKNTNFEVVHKSALLEQRFFCWGAINLWIPNEIRAALIESLIDSRFVVKGLLCQWRDWARGCRHKSASLHCAYCKTLNKLLDHCYFLNNRENAISLNFPLIQPMLFQWWWLNFKRLRWESVSIAVEFMQLILSTPQPICVSLIAICFPSQSSICNLTRRIISRTHHHGCPLLITSLVCVDDGIDTFSELHFLRFLPSGRNLFGSLCHLFSITTKFPI